MKYEDPFSVSKNNFKKQGRAYDAGVLSQIDDPRVSWPQRKSIELSLAACQPPARPQDFLGGVPDTGTKRQDRSQVAQRKPDTEETLACHSPPPWATHATCVPPSPSTPSPSPFPIPLCSALPPPLFPSDPQPHTTPPPPLHQAPLPLSTPAWVARKTAPRGLLFGPALGLETAPTG